MSKMRKILAGALMCVLCLSGGSAMAASGQHEVTANKLYFREEADTDGKVIARLSQGMVVTVLDTDDGWAKVRWDGKEGYLSLEYLKKINSVSVSGKDVTQLSGTGRMRKDTLMYKAADDSSEKIMEVKKDTKVTLLGETVNFYYIKADGKYGYVVKGRVTLDQSTSAAGSEKSEKTEQSEKSEQKASEVLRAGSQGEAVKKLQSRLCELGYLKEKYVTGYYGELTESAVTKFQLRAGLEADGVAGPATQSKLESSSAPRSQKVIEMDWYKTNVSSLVYKRGGTAKIIDCATGTVINIRRVGGSNHMDIEPLTAEDTAKLKKLYGGTWSWKRRSVILVADGKYIAASINGMPHGSQISTTNNFEGQFCLHTTNSRTHGTDKVDSEHQKYIQRALNFS